jgi:hypothetical protein
LNNVPLPLPHVCTAYELKKRFSEFSEIFMAVKGQCRELAAFAFPSKTITATKHSGVIKEKRRLRFAELVKVPTHVP